MHKGLKEPHLFNAGANPLKLIKNLEQIISAAEIRKIRFEIDSNVVGLYMLGESHFNFARSLPQNEWRQRVSRLYYAAYNVRRSVALKHDGSFSTDSSDHKNVNSLPDALDNNAAYKSKLLNLRDDRNLCDYNHLATEQDLLIPLVDCEQIVSDFLSDAKKFLDSQGVNV